MTTYEGVDVSGTDKGPIDWAAFRQAGRPFAIARAHYKMVPDPDFPGLWAGMKAAKITRGAYLFWDSVHDPVKMADAVWTTVTKAGGIGPGDLPIAVDVESKHGLLDSGVSPAQAIERLTATVARFEELMGVPPMIYTSHRVWMEDLKNIAAPALSRCPLWVARWSPAEPQCPDVWGSGNWWIHQHAGDHGGVPGVSRKADLDRFHALSEGASGPLVASIQKRLRLPVTNVFDEATLTAVHAFQEAHRLRVDGVVGPLTWSHLVWTLPN